MELLNTYLKPATIHEAINMAIENAGDFRYLAGGTDVMVNKYQANDLAECLIDITGIEELKQAEYNGTHLKIGSLIRLDDLKNHSVIVEKFPALIEAAYAVASPVIRKTATLGGNILCENRCIFYNQSAWWREAVGYCLKCNGDICIATGGKKACFSRFVSDTAPVLIAYGAEVEILDINGLNTIPLEDLYTGDGLKPVWLSNTAIIKSIILPAHQTLNCIFKKLRPREGVDFTSLTSAVSVSPQGHIKIVLGGLDPQPIVIKGSITDNPADLIKKALKTARVIDNDVYSRKYRRHMLEVYLRQSFEALKLFENPS
jgi:4-hydroxybenzoyl-CoA reductase subunit beta